MLARLLALVLLLAGSALQLAAEASAHAAFVRSDPADGSLLAEAPDRFHLVFSEPVSPLVLTLVGGSGVLVRLDRFELHDTALVIDAPAELAEGSYALSWRVTSADGHPIAGSVVFSVGTAGPVADVPSGNGAEHLRPFIWAAKLALYLGLFLGVGALPFHHLVAPAPRSARNVLLVMIGLGLASILPSLALHGLDLLGEPPGALLQAGPWTAALASAYGRTLVVAAAALLFALAAWLVPGRMAPRGLAALAVLGSGIALAASGHASLADPQWLMRPAVLLHAVAIAVWAGSLVPFAAMLGKEPEAARKALPRYSTVLLSVVLILVLSGTVLAVVQVGSFDALWSTAYGNVLLAKLLLLLGLFTLAAINRFGLTPALVRREPAAARQFGRSVRLEIVLVCAVLAVASLWRFTPPPRSLAAAEAASATVHIHTDRAMAMLSVSPARAGMVTAAVEIQDANLQPMEPKEVALSLSNAQAGVEPIRRALTRSADGWRADALLLPVPGVWKAEIDVLVSDFEQMTLSGEIVIKP